MSGAHTCRYCGRTAKSQFIQMADGQWRCKSPDYCQRRTRRARGIAKVISESLQNSGLPGMAGDRAARAVIEALSREGYEIESGALR